ncbi:MAG TPA: sulfotransferase [Rhizomicrobium sp.]|jgi:tetratricopeptide (TPR) repeat protein
MAETASDPTGSLATALSHTERLLATNPRAAEMQAREILRAVPGHPQALTLAAAGLRGQGRYDEAEAILAPLAAQQPNASAVHLELGLTLGALGEGKRALAAVARAIALKPSLFEAWRALGDLLTLADDRDNADAAYARHIKASVHNPQLVQAAGALCDGKLAIAERLLRDFLKEHPTDVAAIRMLGETGMRLGRFDDAENLFARCVELAPSFEPARHNYATVLYRKGNAAKSLEQVETLLARDPRNPNYRSLKAAALSQLGETKDAAAIYEALLKSYPQQPKAWMSYGHALKTLGRQAESIAAYRKAIAQQPTLGEAYWSLANLKTFRFTPEEIAQMEVQLARGDLEDEDRFHLDFALGKALEDAGAFAQSFAHYEKANALRRKTVDYSAAENTAHVARSIALFTPEFFASRKGSGSDAPDPIFVVGLPRAGSTLVEQILSSHSAVEGTMELPDILSLARRLSRRKRPAEPSLYPEALRDLDPPALKALGEEYLERTRVQRKTGRPFFIDKMPNNFAHIGLIHLILPNARIIDARRHPLGCCFSGFKQHFARGQAFTYSLDDIGRYYADYVALMAHFDAVLPGRIHRVFYERMVDNPEAEVRALLAYCGLPFEDACLRFYETERLVRTASSEQVRMPIFRDGLDQWQNFDPWLAPLKAALGPVLASYPQAPKV